MAESRGLCCFLGSFLLLCEIFFTGGGFFLLLLLSLVFSLTTAVVGFKLLGFALNSVEDFFTDDGGGGGGGCN